MNQLPVLDRCECCGTNVNLQWVEGFLLCRYAASEMIHDRVYPTIGGLSMAPYTYDCQPLPCSDVSSVFLAGPSSDTRWRNTAFDALRVGGFRGRIVIPEFRNGIFDKSRFDDGKPSTVPGMSRSSERILDWETAGIENSSVLMVWMPYTDFADPRHWTGLSTRSEASRAIGSHEGRKRLVLGMPDDAFRSGQERYHAHRNGLTIHKTLHATCESVLHELGVK